MNETKDSLKKMPYRQLDVVEINALSSMERAAQLLAESDHRNKAAEKFFITSLREHMDPTRLDRWLRAAALKAKERL